MPDHAASADLLPRLSPAQERTFAALCAGLRSGTFHDVFGAPGAGVSTVLRHAHARFGGRLLTARDLFGCHGQGHPLAIEESVAAVLRDALRAVDVLFVDDVDVLMRVLAHDCGSYPRRGYVDLMGHALADDLRLTGKRVVFGRGSMGGVDARQLSWCVPHFKAEDYRQVCENILGIGTVAGVDFGKVFRSARELTGHQLYKACRRLMGAGPVTTERFVAYLESQQLVSNVDLAQVTPMSFDDLKGVDDLLQALEAHVITPLENDALATELGVRPKRGVLLAGPPGTGKTSVGRALAHRLKSRFFLIDGTFIADLGNFYQAVDRVFEAATLNAPSVVFIDDTDVIFENGGATGLYRYLLTKLDGLESEGNAHVCVMMTAMDVASMPPALIRSGRIELWLETRLPDDAGRAAILRDLAARAPEAFRGVHVNRLAANTAGLTGADLKRLFEDGKLLYAYDRAKGLPPREVTNYFLDAIEAVRHNKQRYAEAERAARARRPIRPTYYDQGPGADDDAMPF
jgi:AAA+ superfamily predicted ATPase